MNNNGYFLISLDFELHWGRFDKVELTENRKKELENTRQLIPQMLQLFKQYDVSVTWAVVGMLFNKDENEWKSNLPASLPKYTTSNLSAYDYYSNLEARKFSEKSFFAKDLIKQIAEQPNQEIASHTYSHFYCLEPGQDGKNFEDDIFKAKELMNQNKYQLDSLVFPRNQFNIEYLQMLNDIDLLSIRTNPNVWYWNAEDNNLIRRFFRLIDTFNFFSYSKCLQLSFFLSQKSKPYLLPSSRFFKSWNPNKIVNYFKLKRILLEMTFSARNNRYYHLWWHPENFGAYPNDCLQELEKILQHYQKLNAKYNFKSESMNSFSVLIHQSTNA